MSEGNIGMTSGYGELIEEVFIKPIRTVVVVDDEFPTVDSLLDKEIGTAGLSWTSNNLERARQIIQFCRDDKHRWMVDIHDGRQLDALQVEGETAAHLHQSDLMILDFHLNKERPEDGGDAIGILRRLADNDHFNLVVVYTKGYGETGGEIPRVAREIAVGLSTEDARLIMPVERHEIVKKLIEEWEDTDVKIAEKISQAVDDGIYLKAKMLPPGKIDWSKVCLWDELLELKTLVENAPENLKSKMSLFVMWALHRRQEILAAKLSTNNLGTVGLDLGGASGVNWIRTDRLFVTVVSKSEEPSSLPDRLRTALHQWNPEPHRLLMSKMRAELDERGVLAEERVLGDRHLQAGWLNEYLTDDPDDRHWKVRSTVSRHWEGLGDAIKNDVVEFADRLAIHLRDAGRMEVVSRWYPSITLDEMTNSLNHYVSSKSAVEGGYLTTGHVLRLDGNTGDSRFWLCLSPACDLVPGQKNSGWHKRLKTHTPFIAVQLFDAKKENALQYASTGNYLFLKVDNEFKCFSFIPSSSANEEADVARAANPKWEQMFVAQQGRFQGEGNQLMIARAAGDENGLLAFMQESAQVVAHLRYEYALNLLHRLGANLSRVGLDFVGTPFNATGNGQAHA